MSYCGGIIHDIKNYSFWTDLVHVFTQGNMYIIEIYTQIQTKKKSHLGVKHICP